MNYKLDIYRSFMQYNTSYTLIIQTQIRNVHVRSNRIFLIFKKRKKKPLDLQRDVARLYNNLNLHLTNTVVSPLLQLLCLSWSSSFLSTPKAAVAAIKQSLRLQLCCPQKFPDQFCGC